MTSVRSLGRGLSALLGDMADDESMVQQAELPVQKLNIQQIRPGSVQPRQYFSPETLEALASSIVQKGVLQPLLVRKMDNDIFEIVAGERRWRAAQMAGLKILPVIIVHYNDQEALEIGLIENLQRDDLNPIEEAEALQKLIQSYERTQEEAASVIGKSRSYVTNILRLLQLPVSVQQMIREGRLSASHARTLIHHDQAESLAKKIVEEGLNVRDTEFLTKNKNLGYVTKKTDDVFALDASMLAEQFSRTLGVACVLKVVGERAELKIHFRRLEEIDELLSRFQLL